MLLFVISIYVCIDLVKGYVYFKFQKVQFKFKQQKVNLELIFRYLDYIEFGLWIVRYSCFLLLLIMGFWGLGLNKNLYYLLIDVESVSKE